MKKNILFFCCFLVMAAMGLKAQEIRPMPADSAYGVVHISVCNMREEGKFTSGMSTPGIIRNAGQGASIYRLVRDSDTGRLYRMGTPYGNHPYV